MTEKLILYKELFKLNPKLQTIFFIGQRLTEVKQFLEKIQSGLPEDEDLERCFCSMITRCEEEREDVIFKFGKEVLESIIPEMNEENNE